MHLNNESENPWDLLQQPALPSGAIDSRYRLLLAALDQGWRVDEPIYFRPRWNKEGSWVYHFILKNDDPERTQLLTVSQGQDIEHTIHREGWRLDTYNFSLPAIASGQGHINSPISPEEKKRIFIN